MAVQNPQQITVDGTTVTLAAANNADTIPVGQRTLLVVFNGSGSPITVTVNVNAAYKAANNTALTDTTKTVAAGAFALIPIELTEYRDPTTQEADIDYSATTDVTRGVVRL